MIYKELESKRLLLKKVDVSYAQEILATFDRKITRYMYPKADETMEEVIAFIEMTDNGIKSKTSYHYAIVAKETGEFLGVCGYEGVGKPILELGIWVKESAHHQKYGLEAVQCLYDYAEEYNEYESFVYPVDRRNIGSRRIAEALGGVCDKEIIDYRKNGNGEDLEMITYHIARKTIF